MAIDDAGSAFGVSVNTETCPLFVTYGDQRRVASITVPVELNGL
jgi:hypothetical protein